MSSKILPERLSDLAAIRDVLECESRAIALVAARIDEAIEQPLDLMFTLRGRLIFTGVGKMGYIGRKAAATFCSTGSPAIFLHAGEAAHGDLGIVTKDDVVVALSNSGQTAELLNLLPYLRRFDIPMICITGNTASELARRSRYTIDIGIASEADPNQLAPTSSTTVALAICDALAIALARRRGFTKDQFAIFHPGGNLGRKLLLTTAELMHRGVDIPCAEPDVSLRDAMLEVSKKRLGAILIVDSANRLQGIVTDGDIRRILQQNHDPWGDSIACYMSGNPIRIAEQSLAADALRLMQDSQITVLPVVNADSTVCGIVHLHDLIRAGLA